MDLTGKVALVTGGASGIGLAIVEELLTNEIKGAVIVDINAEVGKTVVSELTDKYGPDRVIFYKTDICNQQECEDAFKAAINNFGYLDIVINNAGVVNDINYEKEISINLTGVMHNVALALKFMSKDNGGNGGTVLSISSTLALEYVHSVPVYSSTKVAVMTLMQGFGHPFHYDRTGIRMMALLPGRTTPTSFASDMETFGDIKEVVKMAMATENQKPSAVSLASIHLLKYGESASSWVIQGSKLYLLEIPEWKSYASMPEQSSYTKL